MKESDNNTGENILVGGTGVLIDYRFARKGYAKETLCAVVEYRFNGLGCGEITLDTYTINASFRNLMKVVSLEHVVALRRIGDGPPDEEGHYEFGVQKWSAERKYLVCDEEWPL